MDGKIYISKELFINSEYRYTSLSASTAPNLRQKLRVRMINAQGLEEAGVDGGGIFRYRYICLTIRTKLNGWSHITTFQH